MTQQDPARPSHSLTALAATLGLGITTIMALAPAFAEDDSSPICIPCPSTSLPGVVEGECGYIDCHRSGFVMLEPPHAADQGPVQSMAPCAGMVTGFSWSTGRAGHRSDGTWDPLQGSRLMTKCRVLTGNVPGIPTHHVVNHMTPLRHATGQWEASFHYRPPESPIGQVGLQLKYLVEVHNRQEMDALYSSCGGNASGGASSFSKVVVVLDAENIPPHCPHPRFDRIMSARSSPTESHDEWHLQFTSNGSTTSSSTGSQAGFNLEVNALGAAIGVNWGNSWTSHLGLVNETVTINWNEGFEPLWLHQPLEPCTMRFTASANLQSRCGVTRGSYALTENSVDVYLDGEYLGCDVQCDSDTEAGWIEHL